MINSIENDQANSNLEVAANNFSDIKQSLKQATDEELLTCYNVICRQSTSFIDISQKFQIPLTKDELLNHSGQYRKRINKWRNNFIKQIISKLKNNSEQAPKINLRGFDFDEINDLGEEAPSTLLKPINNKPVDKLYFQPIISPNQLSKVHLKPLTENDELRKRVQQLERENQMLRNYIQEINSKQLIKQVPEQKQAMNNKSRTRKLITEGIPTRIHPMPSIREIPQPPLAPKIDALNAYESIKKYGESDEFRKHHKQKSFNEWRNVIKKQNETLKEYEEMIDKNNDDALSAANGIGDDYLIYLDVFDKEGLKKLMPLLHKLITKIDSNYIDGKYQFGFLVNNVWHYQPYRKEVRDKFLEAVNKMSFIYEIDEQTTITSDAAKIDADNWCLFNAILIRKNKWYKGINKDNGGSFFPYLINADVIDEIKTELVKCQIFDEVKPYDDCCLIYALKQSGKFTNDELNKMRMRIKRNYLTQADLKMLCDEFKFKIIAKKPSDNDKQHKTNFIKNNHKNSIGAGEREINLGLIGEHWFLNEGLTNITKDYINHIDSAPINAFNKRMKRKGDKIYWEKTNETKRFLTPLELITELMNQNKFTPITYATASILKTDLYDYIKDNEFPLEYNPETCLRLIEPNKFHKQFEFKHIFHADFEADVSGKIHQAYSVNIQSDDGLINESFYGFNCAKQFLERLPDKSLVYFFNLAYDASLFMKHVYKINHITKKSNSHIYQIIVSYKSKIIEFRDMLPLCQCKLADLPKAFDIKDIKKELYPYKYYTMSRVKSNIGIINEAGKFEDKPWNQSDYDLFNENIDSIPGCRISENEFDLKKYCEFYNSQDVTIQRLAFDKLRNELKEVFNINVYDVLTAAAVAKESIANGVYYPNGNLYEVGGNVREFMSKAIYGGRCMCACNKKWHVKEQLADLDAKSLYPSAIKRLYTVEGKPEVLNVTNPETIYKSMPDYLQKYSTKLSSPSGYDSNNGVGAFVVEIKILKANKHYALPIIVQKTKDGNKNDDRFTEPIIMVVDNIALEDLIEFQQIEFQVIKGYVWNGSRDYRCREFIQNLFDAKTNYEKQGKKALVFIAKLILNSTYGKSIQKPIETETIFKSTYKPDSNTPNAFEKYWQKNYQKIIEAHEINKSTMKIKVKKAIDKHFNFSLFGIQILSMSKRIMNEVTCLAYDLGIRIYYTDTDSFMIQNDKIDMLAEAFKQKYNRELIGNQLGNFHSDFDPINDHKEVPVSIESYFITKKCYIHKLTDSTGEIGYAFRCKGITKQAIERRCQEIGFMNLYKSLFDGNKQVFDLAEQAPVFEFNDDFTVMSLKNFTRTIKTDYETGLSEEYFEY